MLGLAQLLLPGLAARRVRSEIGRYGVVHSAAVSAFPAIELLWGHAQSVAVSAGSLDMPPAAAAELLWNSRGVGRVDMHADTMRVGSFTLHDVTWRKRGDRLFTSGLLTEADLRASLPGATGFALLGRDPTGVSMRVSGSLFGVAATVDVQLSAVGGKLVATPEGLPFASLVKITLLSAPHMYVQSFGLAASPGSGAQADPSYRVTVGARLR